MLAELIRLDTRIGPQLVRPFWMAGTALAFLLAGIGLVVGLATLPYSGLLSLFAIALGGLAGVTVLLGVRLTVEATSIVFQQAGTRPSPGATVSRTA